MVKTTRLEEGSASVIIKLTGGVIYVYHGSTGELIKRKPVKRGFWNKLWKLLE